jgi:hypothetical protein
MRNLGRLHLPLAALLACTIGCKAELSANLKVDGNTFGPSSCRSGEPNGFAGVDLIDDGGATLRVVQTPTMQPHAILIIGQEIVDLGPCGTMSLERQNSMVNDITNVMGNATLKCEANGHAVVGTVSFKNCH